MIVELLVILAMVSALYLVLGVIAGLLERQLPKRRINWRDHK